MRDYVVYHNPDVMGEFGPEHINGSVVTGKPVDKLIGDRIWLLTGSGKPRDFYLCEIFTVDDTDYLPGEDYPNVAIGNGYFFEPYPILNNLAWFSEFLKSQGNFAFGLNEIETRFVKELESVESRSPKFVIPYDRRYRKRT